MNVCVKLASKNNQYTMSKYLKLTLLSMMMLTQTISNAQYKHRLPAKRTAAEWRLTQERNSNSVPIFAKKGVTMPEKVRYPGEFEESQVVLISWADLYDDNDKYIGADTVTEWGYVSAQLTEQLQKEVPVWIRAYTPADTITIKAFLNTLGISLYNYRFIVSYGDAWWIRDFGPNGIYYGNQDSLAFVDLKYYDGRDRDDAYARLIGTQMGLPVFQSKMHAEGGNLMTDGFGKVFFSSRLTNVNTSAVVHNPVWTKNQTFDTIRNLFNATLPAELTTLLCDGGTGHIDLYVKMIDEQTIMVVQYPDTITAPDKKKIEDNLQYLTLLQSTYNRPFRIYRIPHPTDDEGKYSRINCTQMDEDARTFVNGITINKTFIYPSYSYDTSGNFKQTQEVTNLFKRIMPGYKVVPIDSRALSLFGGELHCITMQIPADNPVTFWHPSVDGKQPKLTTYRIVSKITNRSGIQSAVCKWRKRDGNWNTLNLIDSSGYFIGDMNIGTASDDDVFEYYIEATTNNGKTARKPITAPEGFYQLYFKSPITANEEIEIKPRDYLFGAFPNPANQFVNIRFTALQPAQAIIQLTDISGKLVFVKNIEAKAGLNELNIPTELLKPGMYFYSCTLDNATIGTRKLMVNH